MMQDISQPPVEALAEFFRTPVVRRLSPRQREVVTIVYCNPGITAKGVGERLIARASNETVRTFLRRLTAKGLLRHQKGAHGAFLYSPAIVLPDLQERIIERAANEYFEGSLLEISSRAVMLLKRSDPKSFSDFCARLNGRT
jgi:predicted transcriptional regulator